MQQDRHHFGRDEAVVRWLTLLSLCVIGTAMLWLSRDFAVSGDELLQNWYGEKVLAWYLTLGADKGALSTKGDIMLYGGMFDLLCASVNRWLPFGETFQVRHFINAAVGFATICFAARLARLYGGWAAALVTVWLLVLSPRFLGDCMNNPKDIPFALGMTIGTYAICRMASSFPAARRGDLVLLALGIGVSIGVRAGGLLLFFYIPVGLGFAWLGQLAQKGGNYPRGVWLKLFVRVSFACLCGYALAVLCWPYAQLNPLLNPLRTLRQLSDYNLFSLVLFEGKDLPTNGLPWYYLPKWIGITTPVVILVLFLISAMRTGWRNRSRWFLLFAVLFPFLFVLLRHSPLYDGWRHFLFLYPPMVVLASLVFVELLGNIKSRLLRTVLVVALIASLVPPVLWNIRNHPLESVYFNELTGGINGAYARYETDYYMNGLEMASEKLDALAHLRDAKDTVVVATNCLFQFGHYMQCINPKVKCIYLKYPARNEQYWDYGVFWTRWVDVELLRNGSFPPVETVEVVEADSVVLYAIARRRLPGTDSSANSNSPKISR